MKHEMMPVVDANDLYDAVVAQYGPAFSDEVDVIANLLFDTDYQNYSYKRYSFKNLLTYEGHFWEDENQIRLENCVRSVLQDAFPNYDAVLIDVSW